jgi:hypothetical protein
MMYQTLRPAASAPSCNPAKRTLIKTCASRATHEVHRRRAGRTAAFGLWLLTAAAAPLADAPAFGETPARVRGTITAIAEGTITVQERDGRSFTLKTGPDTIYADVVPSSLDAIKLKDYIGTAVKGPPNHWIAVEIVIVPKSMQAGRKGDYAWDPLPDTSGIHASGITATTMTNGFVSSVSRATSKLTNTSMTNGTIVASNSNAAGRALMVNLVGNKTARIVVSPTAPIVRFVPSDRSAISVGSINVVWTKPGSRAVLVAVGKGVSPPM